MFGQLGIGTHDSKSKPFEIVSLSDKGITSVALGCEHSVLLTNKGAVYVFGRNNFGQLGLNHTSDRTQPQVVPELDDVHISRISAGNHSTFLVANDGGGVYTFGLNDRGQLGVGDKRNRMKATRIRGLEISDVVEVRTHDLTACVHMVLIMSDYTPLWIEHSNMSLGQVWWRL